MNKMYEYLKNHAYISYNKKSTYEFELSEERAECIANKYDSLTEELQQENKILRDNAEHNEKVVNKVNWENMLLKKENQQLKEKLDCDLQWAFKYEKQVDNWNKLREYFNERIEVCDNRLSSPFCNFEKTTKERLIFSQCLEKLEELQGSDSNE